MVLAVALNILKEPSLSSMRRGQTLLDYVILDMDELRLLTLQPTATNSGPSIASSEFMIMETSTSPIVKFIQSLRGCTVEEFVFENGDRLEPSSIVLHVRRRNRDFGAVGTITTVSVLDRSGYRVMDGIELQQTDLVDMVKFLQQEVRRGERFEIEDIQIKELQESHESNSLQSESLSLMWKAFIQIRLKWRNRTAVIGNLIDDVGTGLRPDEMNHHKPYFGEFERKKARAAAGDSRSYL